MVFVAFDIANHILFARMKHRTYYLCVGDIGVDRNSNQLPTYDNLNATFKHRASYIVFNKIGRQ